MTHQKAVEIRPEAKAYVDSVLEAMRSHGATPDLRPDAYDRTVSRVSNAFEGLRTRH